MLRSKVIQDPLSFCRHVNRLDLVVSFKHRLVSGASMTAQAPSFARVALSHDDRCLRKHSKGIRRPRRLSQSAEKLVFVLLRCDRRGGPQWQKNKRMSEALLRPGQIPLTISAMGELLTKQGRNPGSHTGNQASKRASNERSQPGRQSGKRARKGARKLNKQASTVGYKYKHPDWQSFWAHMDPGVPAKIGNFW